MSSTKMVSAWPTVTCHSGPEVFSLSVFGEEKPMV
jgi:hypothetical protein